MSMWGSLMLRVAPIIWYFSNHDKYVCNAVMICMHETVSIITVVHPGYKR